MHDPQARVLDVGRGDVDCVGKRIPVPETAGDRLDLLAGAISFHRGDLARVPGLLGADQKVELGVVLCARVEEGVIADRPDVVCLHRAALRVLDQVESEQRSGLKALAQRLVPRL